MGTVELKEDIFGTYTDSNDDQEKVVKRFTWISESKFIFQVISYGATITSIKIPDGHGHSTDIVMGFDNIKGYLNPKNPYFGATIGRYANRIKDGKFQLNEIEYALYKNAGENHYHGGVKGFDKVNWNSYVTKNKVVFSYLSVDGEEGYPGTLLAQVGYQVINDSLKINMKCMCTEPTPINLTNHTYFNLYGHDSGSKELYKHEFAFNINGFTPFDENQVTTGKKMKLSEVGVTYDVSIPHPLNKFMPEEGLDVNLCVNKKPIKNKYDTGKEFIAKISHPESKLILEVFANSPGVQFYTANCLPEFDQVGVTEEFFVGKYGCHYYKHGGFCFEPQFYPNSLNYDHFPCSILNPGEEYIHEIDFKFKLLNE